MSRVFLADTETYVEVPDASWPLAKICEAFQVDSSSAYIRNATTGTVVATRPSESLPEFSGNNEYILCASSSSSSTSHHHHQHHQHHTSSSSDLSNNTGGGEDADAIQFAVLRMAQLVDSLGASSINNHHHHNNDNNFDDEDDDVEVGNRPAATAGGKNLGKFFQVSDQIYNKAKRMMMNPTEQGLSEEVDKKSVPSTKVGQDSSSNSINDTSSSSLLSLEELLKSTNIDLMVKRENAMFVSSEDHYSPETLKGLMKQISSKKKNINSVQYSFS